MTPAADHTLHLVRTALLARNIACGPLTRVPVICLNTIATDGADVLVKVSSTHETYGAHAEVASALWAARHQMPTPTPLWPEPITVPDGDHTRTVTVWRREDVHTGPFTTPAALHRAAIETAMAAFDVLHQTPAPAHATPVSRDQMMRRITRRLALPGPVLPNDPTRVAGLDGPALVDGIRVAAADAHRDLRGRWPRNAEWWTHGDLHPDNILFTTRGPLIGDWGSACLAVPEWDFAPLFTPLVGRGALRMHSTEPEPAPAPVSGTQTISGSAVPNPSTEPGTAADSSLDRAFFARTVDAVEAKYRPDWDLLGAIIRFRAGSWASMLWERGAHPDRILNFAAFLSRPDTAGLPVTAASRP